MSWSSSAARASPHRILRRAVSPHKPGKKTEQGDGFAANIAKAGAAHAAVERNGVCTYKVDLI